MVVITLFFRGQTMVKTGKKCESLAIPGTSADHSFGRRQISRNWEPKFQVLFTLGSEGPG